MNSSDQPHLEFDLYPNNVLVHPSSKPIDLIDYLKGKSADTFTQAAHACVREKSWEHLAAMRDAGFDIAGCHFLGRKELHVGETLLHHCLRTQMFDYDGCQSSMRELIALGVDPKGYNGQGISVLGLAASFTKDLPPHRSQQIIELLLEHGVHMSDPCHDGVGLGRHLLDYKLAHQIIAAREPLLAKWATSLYEQEVMLDETPKTRGTARSLRL